MKKLLFSAAPLQNRAIDAAWLLFRLHLGLSIAIGAGWSKLINLTTAAELDKIGTVGSVVGPPDWFVQQVAGLGFTFPSPYLWATLAVWGEFAGGLLIAFGLFTRLSALQLAFQFFVIAFLWYEAPEPVVGMYYQQVLFWAFVVITAVGPGRYSLDYLLTRRRSTTAPNTEMAAETVQVSASSVKPASVVAAVIGLMLLAATVGWADNSLRSNLFVQPNEQFVLGGNQAGAFKVQARNKGRVTVEIKERTKGGDISKGTLRPGQIASLRFMPGSAALVVNSSDQVANLALVVTGDTGALEMRNVAKDAR